MRFLQDILLNRLLADQSVNVNIPSLPYSMAAVLRLSIHRRIPIAIVEDNGVRSGQVYTDATASGGQNEAEDLGVVIETLHQHLVNEVKRI